ncbi:MAG: two-component system response regulator [Paenibacillus sp.]|nr:two-component system response regulator [Paenibacillus sp.]
MYKVLLVDDEMYIRKGLRTLVEWNKYGFEICDEAENGEQALDLIRSQSPDLVITDIKMPVLDGLDLIKNVVSSSSNMLPKFIILSGFNEFKFAQQAVRYGVYDFILKPVDEDELESTLEKLSIQFMQYNDLDNKLYSSLKEYVEDCDSAGAETVVNQMFAQFQKKQMVPQIIHASISRCVLGIVELIKQAEGSEHNLQTFDAIANWKDNLFPPAELKRLFLKFVFESIEHHQLRKYHTHAVIYKIKAYIETHYRENINLKHIAADFLINPVYLGQLFKKTYGIYFNEFLLNIRLQEAKKLLRQTDLKVYEIAEKTGFNNPDYFVNQFKKIERQTPTEYRHHLINIKEG